MDNSVKPSPGFFLTPDACESAVELSDEAAPAVELVDVYIFSAPGTD
jgi:hypothetical protein